MQDEEILWGLEALVQSLAIDLRYEKGDFVGGLCRLEDKRLLILNQDLPVSRKIKILAGELGTMDLEGVYILPALRKVIEEGGSEGRAMIG